MAYYDRDPNNFAKKVRVVNPNNQSARFRDDTHKILSAVAFHCESGQNDPIYPTARWEPTKISELEKTITKKIKKVAEEINISKFGLFIKITY